MFSNRLLSTDAIVISPTASSNLIPSARQMLKSAVPIINMKPSLIPVLGLGDFRDGGQTKLVKSDRISLQPFPSHSITAGLGIFNQATANPGADIQLFNSGKDKTVGLTDVQLAEGASVLGRGASGHAIFAVWDRDVSLPNSFVDSADRTPDCRVIFPANSSETLHEDSMFLLTRAVAWTTGPECGSQHREPASPHLSLIHI